MNTKRHITIFLVLALVLTTCFVPGEKASAKKKVALNKSKLTLNVGATYKLKVKNNKKKVKWTSSARKVATVSQKGVVKACKAGKAKITAKIGKKKYVCTVTVRNKAKDLTPSDTPQPTNPATNPPASQTTNQPPANQPATPPAGQTTNPPGGSTPVENTIAGNYQKLKTYLLTYGSTNSTGGRFISDSFSGDTDYEVSYGIIYNATAAEYTFIILMDGDSYSSSLSLIVKEEDLVNGNLENILLLDSLYYGDFAAHVPLSDITSENNLTWEILDTNMTVDATETCNILLDLGYLEWDLLLSTTLDMNLTDLGFGA